MAAKILKFPTPQPKKDEDEMDLIELLKIISGGVSDEELAELKQELNEMENKE